MGYLSIDNLYKNQAILLFRECYALEKVHGTSAHLSYKADRPLTFFAGGEDHAKFVALFEHQDLMVRFASLGHSGVTVYGEAYGGKQQGMRSTYGDVLRFIVFDVKIGDRWLSVPDMAQIATGLGLEVVPYSKVATDIAVLDSERDAPSIVANRRGCGDDKHREGVVLRPLIEVTLNNGDRVIAKHKMEEFSERATPQKIVDPAKLQVLAQADAIAREWVTPMRLTHVLDKLGEVDIKLMPVVIAAMVDDVYREAAGEIVEGREAKAAIGRRTADLFKRRLRDALHAKEQP